MKTIDDEFEDLEKKIGVETIDLRPQVDEVAGKEKINKDEE